MTTATLNEKFDQMRALEEAGKLQSKGSGRALRKMLNNRLAVAGLIIFGIILLAAVFAPWLTQYDPGKIDLRARLQPPSWQHFFGTDATGRDIYTRVIYGGRISILVGLGSALMAAAVGVIIGSYTGYKGSWVDMIALRISEIVTSFPQIILVLMIVTIVGQSLLNLILIFVLTGWGQTYRLVRARMLSIREEEYVQALQSFGIGTLRVCYKHMLPNALGPVMVNITLTTAAFILAEAGLSFLGLGVPSNIATWGNILIAANDLRVLQNNWWVWLPVGVVISLFVLAVNFIGDGLRDSTDSTVQG